VGIWAKDKTLNIGCSRETKKEIIAKSWISEGWSKVKISNKSKKVIITTVEERKYKKIISKREEKWRLAKIRKAEVKKEGKRRVKRKGQKVEKEIIFWIES
jgi:hypothetical protein